MAHGIQNPPEIHLSMKAARCVIQIAWTASTDGQAEALMRKGCQGFIPKPFIVTVFSNYVRQILDAAKI
jgi:hypothetical protein